MHFTNDSTGFISLEYGYNVIKTSDSGKTWELCKKNNSYEYLGYGFTSAFFLTNQLAWFGGNGEYLMITTDGASQTIPASKFSIDTTGVTNNGLVHLFNHSKPNYQYQWFVNGSLIATSYDASYVHKVTDTIDRAVILWQETFLANPKYGHKNIYRYLIMDNDWRLRLSLLCVGLDALDFHLASLSSVF
jgi:hypothetical protein